MKSNPTTKKTGPFEPGKSSVFIIPARSQMSENQSLLVEILRSPQEDDRFRPGKARPEEGFLHHKKCLLLKDCFFLFKFTAQKTSCHPAIHAPIFKGLHEPAPQGMSGSLSFEIRPAFEGRIILESIGLLSSMDTRRQEESPMFSGPFVPSAHIVRDKGRNFISHLPAARNSSFDTSCHLCYS